MANYHAVRIGVLSVALAGICHGASAQSSFCKAVDFPGGMEGRTIVYGINNKGHVVGEYGTPTDPTDPCECDQKTHGFALINGQYIAINVDGANLTAAFGINDSGQIVGAVEGSSFANGFLRQPNGQITSISAGDITSARAINNAGTIVGFWNPIPAPDYQVHGFMMPAGGAPQTIDSGLRFTSLDGISNSGVIVGNATDGPNSFMFTWTNGALAQVSSPFGQPANVYGVNTSGKISGIYGGFHGFTAQDGLAGDFNCPGALGTYVHGMNDMGQIVGQYVDGTTSHGFYTPPIALVDPAPDLVRTGGVLTTEPEALATQGRDVQGASADGVTVVLLRIPTPNQGDQVTLTVLKSDAPGDVASSVNEYGGVGTPSQVCCEFTINVASQGTTAAGPMAFATYRVPKDFPRESVDDTGKASRDVFLRIDVAGAGSSIIPVHLLRPPVALVHGIWSDSKSWNGFTPLTNGTLDTGDARFQVKRISYDKTVSVSSSTPAYSDVVRGIAGLLLHDVKENALGFDYNAGVVLKALQLYIRDFKRGLNPEHLSIAAVQADLVVHSMGGDVARAVMTLPDQLRRDNYFKGVIHKMISLDTPHLGTPVANRLLLSNTQEDNGCLRNGLAIGGSWSFLTASGSFGVATGAVGDLQVNSPELQLLAISTPIPTARIAAQYTNWGSVGQNRASRLCKKLGSSPLAEQLADTPTRWPDVFTDSDDPVNHPNDGLVSVTSQLNAGLGEILPGNIQHSTALKWMGFTSTSVLEFASGASVRVISLLNEPSYRSGGAFDPITP